MNLISRLIVFCLFSCQLLFAQQSASFRPGKFWLDQEGVHINAHGGGFLFHDNVYYWFGEYKEATSHKAYKGVMCYSSENLYEWKNEGVVLAVDSHQPDSPIAAGCIIERPKVIYNSLTGKFVMYFHHELKEQGYNNAFVGVAVSDVPAGPYEYIKSSRVNAGYLPQNMLSCREEITPGNYKEWWTKEWLKAVEEGMFVCRDHEKGQMSRDMTLFVDDDGKAYHIYSSEENLTLHIAELSDDYMNHTGKYIRIEPGGHNEAPALFKKDGTCFMITSGCTGWEPNEARLLVADDILGEWKRFPNPCVGKDAELTFYSQSTFVLPVYGKKDAFIFVGDRWNPSKPIDGTYVWLPLCFENDLPVIKWHDEWTLDYFENR